MASDVQGGYYGASFGNRRWTLDGGVDYLMPVEGGEATIFGTGYAHYQVSGRLGLGGGGNMRQDDSTAWSVFSFVDLENRLGIGRAQVDYASDDLRNRAQLTLNQTWNTPAGTRLGSSLIVGQDSYADEAATAIGVAVNGGGDLRSNLTVDVNARWDNVAGSERTDNILQLIETHAATGADFLGARRYRTRRSRRTSRATTTRAGRARAIRTASREMPFRCRHA